MKISNFSNLVCSFFAVLAFSCTDKMSDGMGECEIICLEIFCHPSEDTTCLDALKADGKTILIIKARVPKDIDEAKNKIIFKSATGKFVSEIDTIAPEVQAVDGEATVLLQVGEIPGVFRIEVEVSDGANKYTASEYLALEEPDDDIIAFDFGATDFSSIRADGETSIRLVAQINQINPLGKKLKLQLDGPMAFAGYNSNAIEFMLNSEGRAECFLKAGRYPGQCFLTAEFEGYQKSYDFKLLSAGPESIILTSVSSQSIPAQNGALDLKTYLYRSTGKVSIDTPIGFNAWQEIQGSIYEIGAFDPPIGKSDSSEVSLVSFSTPADSIVSKDYPIFIRAWVLDNPLIADTLNVQVD